MKRKKTCSNVAQTLSADLFGQAWLGLHVESGLLFEASWTSDTVTQLIA